MHMKVRLSSALKWLLIIFLLLNCHSVYDAGIKNNYLEETSVILAILLLLVTSKSIGKKHLLFVGAFLLYQIPIILYAFTISDYVYTYIIKYIVYFCIIYVIAAYDNNYYEDIMEIFIKLILFISVISLFFYLFSTIVRIIEPTGSYYLVWHPARWVNSFFGIYFEVSGGHTFAFKNSAIFAEAPIFAALLCTASAIELFGKKKINIKRNVIFYITLLSTFSTTAYIYIILSICGIVYVYYNSIKQNRLLKVIFLGFEIIIFFFTMYFAFEILFAKKNAIGQSFLVRSDDYSIALKVIKDHPLLGVGFGNTTFSREYMSSERIATGNFGGSSDFAALLASGGLYFILTYVLGFFGLLKRNDNNLRKNIVFVLSLIYVFIVSRIGSTLLFLTVISCGLANLIDVSNMKKKKR